MTKVRSPKQSWYKSMSYNCFTVDCRAGLSCSISPVFLSLSYSVYLYWARLSVLLKLFCTSVFFFHTVLAMSFQSFLMVGLLLILMALWRWSLYKLVEMAFLGLQYVQLPTTVWEMSSSLFPSKTDWHVGLPLLFSNNQIIACSNLVSSIN